MEHECNEPQLRDMEVFGLLTAFDLDEGTLELHVPAEWPEIRYVTVRFRQEQRPIVVSAGMAMGHTAGLIVEPGEDGELWLTGVQSKMLDGSAPLPALGDDRQPALFPEM